MAAASGPALLKFSVRRSLLALPHAAGLLDDGQIGQTNYRMGVRNKRRLRKNLYSASWRFVVHPSIGQCGGSTTAGTKVTEQIIVPTGPPQSHDLTGQQLQFPGRSQVADP